MLRAGLAAILLTTLVLAGCTSKGSSDSTGVVTKGKLEDGKGGISGLLIDDIYRPIPKGTILLLPNGLTTTSDSSGQFEFRDLDPGTYTIKVDSDGHEAAPRQIDVAVGEYTELELSARRIVSDVARIVTLQYSVFIPCGFSASLVSQINGYCFFDTSSDTYRPGLEGLDFSNYDNQTNGGFNVTYLVAEMQVNQPDYYVVVVREDNGQSFGGEEYGRGLTEGGAYGKVTLQKGSNYMQTDNSAIWNNTKKMAVIIFYYGPGGDQISGVLKPTYCGTGLPNVDNPQSGRPLVGCREYYGVGAKAGVEAKLLLSVFLGPPSVDIGTYQVLSS
jgi:hypothetical protein